MLGNFSDPRDIYCCSIHDLEAIEGLKPIDYSTILQNRCIDNIRKKMESMKRKNITFISYADCKYPLKLRDIYDPPYGLYLHGTLPKASSISLAIIGARNCTPYGMEVARYFSSSLAKEGVQIISGMARGIDSYSHEGAIEVGGYTLAVLGSGIDYCYPKENIELYMSLEKKGGILSEYGPGILPKSGHFPLRNRIISGLCDGILVIEAQGKSGSLITADQGLEQGKDIFSIPGRISDLLSVGTNQLIKYGAQIVTSPEDILEYYNIPCSSDVITSKTGKIVELEEEEKRVFDALSLEPTHINSLSEQLSLDIGNLMKALIQLEKIRLVVQTSKNYYIRVLSEV